MISLTVFEATVGGVQGKRRVVIYGDGTVIRSATGSAAGSTAGQATLERGRLTEGGVQRLLDDAAAKGLLERWGFPPGPSDSGWTRLDLALESGLLELGRDYTESVHKVLMPAPEEVVEQFGQFNTQLWSLDGFVNDRAFTSFVPQRLQLTAARIPPLNPKVIDLPKVSKWPLDTLPDKLFHGMECAVVDSDDARRLHAALPDDTARPAIDVWSATAVPAYVRVFADVLLPGDPECVRPKQWPAELVAPWPGERRRSATAWEEWTALDGVDRAGFEGQLGRVGDEPITRKGYYFHYSVAEVDGREVVDVVGKPYTGSKREPRELAVRVALDTGVILEVQHS